MAAKQVFNTSAELDYPTVLPTLDLDFANSKTLDPRITFTRATGGSYVGADGLIKYAGVNEARFDHDPVTGESLGLLVEESRTNLINYSEDINLWTPSGDSVTIKNQMGPDGIPNSAVSVTDNDTRVDEVRLDRNITITPSAITDYCLSIFAKRGSSPEFALYNFFTGNSTKGSLLIYNFDTDKIVVGGADGGGLLPSIFGRIKYPNGWYRIYYVVRDSNDGVNSNITFRIYPTTRPAGRTGTTIFFGAQLEEGSFPTSYIPTQGSTRTRAKDNVSITGKNFADFYKQGTGTIFSNFSSVGSLSDNRIVYAISDNTFNNSMYLIPAVASAGNQTIQAIILNGSVGGSLSSLKGVYRNYSFVKTAFAFENKNSAFVIDRRDVSKNFTAGIPTVNRIYLGASWVGGGNFLNGHISRLTYYPKRLPDPQLQALTS